MKNIELDHRTRSREPKPAYAHDACNACAYDLFLFRRNSRVLFANFGNINCLSHMEISHQIISGKRSTTFVNHIQEKRKIIILWIPRNNHLKLGTREDKMHEASSPPLHRLPPYLPSPWRVIVLPLPKPGRLRKKRSRHIIRIINNLMLEELYQSIFLLNLLKQLFPFTDPGT